MKARAVISNLEWVMRSHLIFPNSGESFPDFIALIKTAGNNFLIIRKMVNNFLRNNYIFPQIFRKRSEFVVNLHLVDLI